MYTFLGIKKGETISPFTACHNANASTCTIIDNCSIAEDGTCEIDYQKITIEAVAARECQEWGWNEEEGYGFCTKWSEPISTSSAGDIYIADIGDYLNEEGIISNDNNFDYITHAKGRCEAQNAHLATAGELLALNETGILYDGFYFSADECTGTTNCAYGFETAGDPGVYEFNVADYGYEHVICVGNK